MRYTLLFALLILFSCKAHKQPSTKESGAKSEKAVAATDVKKDAQTQTSANSDSLFRLVVFFYSQAGGAEFQLINEYVDSIGVYSQNLGKKIDYKRISWGREGETDVVMHLRELSATQQDDFVAMSRRVLAKGKFVNIYENYHYKQRGK